MEAYNMKKILTILLILSISSICSAGRVQQAYKAVITAKNGAGGETCTVDNDSVLASQTSDDDAYDLTSTIWMSQGINEASDITITGWILELADYTDTGNCECALYTDSSGLPGTIIANTTVSVSAANIGWQLDVPFVLATPYSYTASTQIHLVCGGDVATQQFVWRRNTSGGYAGGGIAYSTNSGTSWDSAGTQDFHFQLTGCTE
jgi:hypothetical protein